MTKPTIRPDRLAIFSHAYYVALDAAAAAGKYEWPREQAGAVHGKMMRAIQENVFGVNYDGPAFKGAAKALGLKHTRKAIVGYLAGE
jgi:hypothetical protein